MTVTRLTSARRASVANIGTLHPECMTWIGNVVSNGGTVSATTAAAVSAFCTAIDAASIRDRFARLNLFCGSNLSAALVPLYRSTAAGGTLLGNSTDTNNNFVSGDYAETGSAGGLAGNGTTKFLNTGLNQSTVNSSGFGHISAFIRLGTFADITYRLMGVLDTSTSQYFFIDVRGQSNGGFVGVHGSSTTFGPGSFRTQSSPELRMVTRSSTSSSQMYVNGAYQSGDATTRTVSSVASPMYVFAENRVGTGAQTHSAVTLGAYSIGSSMTQAQSNAYYLAMAAFQIALNRNSGV